MRYLDHVLQAIERLDYVRAEFGPMLAILLEDNEGRPAREIGKQFRSFGKDLSAEEKQQRGIRQSTLMSYQAYEALTERGRGNPLHAIETTLQSALHGFRRKQVVDAGMRLATATFVVEGMFGTCRGCRRLNGRVVSKDFLGEIPPLDCAHEACAISIKPAPEERRAAAVKLDR